MNANEMADLMILFDSGRIYEHSVEIADMLRQQQAEIEALKKEAALQRLSDFTQEADNKPVAWIGETLMGRQYINGSNGLLPVGTPLYTHPVKELTDEELFKVYADLEEVYTGNNFPVDLGRAILKKAQQ